MKNATIRENIGAALVANTPLETWCDSHYEKSVTVFDGIDRMQLPQPEDSAASVAGDYPFVALDVTEKTQGRSQDDETVVVSVFCAILDDSPYEETTSGVQRLPGIDHRDEFRSLVLAAVLSADIDCGYVSTVESVNLPVDFFPEFAVDMTITIARPYAFRENRFE